MIRLGASQCRRLGAFPQALVVFVAVWFLVAQASPLFAASGQVAAQQTAARQTVAQQADLQTLQVYTYESMISSFGPGPFLEERFESECGCDVVFTAFGDAVSILTRLKLEGEDHKADILLGLDTNLQAAAQDFVAPYRFDLPPLALPDVWTSKLFVPYDYGHFAFVYDREALPNPPKSFSDLLTMNPEIKVLIQDPRTSSPGLGLLLWVQRVYGEGASQFWREFSPRILAAAPGWSEAYGLFLKGEAPVVLSYATSPAYHQEVEKTDRYQAALFQEGHYMQIEVAALTKSSKQASLGRRFLRFLLSPEAQEAFATHNWMRPVLDAPLDIPQALADLPEPEGSLLFSPQEVEQNRKAWIHAWLQVVAQHARP